MAEDFGRTLNFGDSPVGVLDTVALRINGEHHFLLPSECWLFIPEQCKSLNAPRSLDFVF